MYSAQCTVICVDLPVQCVMICVSILVQCIVICVDLPVQCIMICVSILEHIRLVQCIMIYVSILVQCNNNDHQCVVLCFISVSISIFMFVHSRVILDLYSVL